MNSRVNSDHHQCVQFILAIDSVALILPLDGNTAALVSGTETFSDDILNAHIDYAVFGPGVFTVLTTGKKGPPKNRR